MTKPVIVIHGGAGPDSDYIKENKKEYEKALNEALEAGYEVLENNGTAVDAAEAAVKYMEDCELFNCGRGSAINAKGEVEMCCAMMDGNSMKAGAVAIIKEVKNPVTVAKAIMQSDELLYLGSTGAEDFAREIDAAFMPPDYFITQHQWEAYKKKKEEVVEDMEKTAKRQRVKSHGTVGAVALDKQGNVAAATSTGGSDYSHESRIGDSSMIGIGCYAENATCAVSCTGDGEYIIRSVVAKAITCEMKYNKLNATEACDWIINEENKDIDGDMGVIAIDAKGNIGMEFNSERMHRGFKTETETFVKIYKD